MLTKVGVTVVTGVGLILGGIGSAAAGVPSIAASTVQARVGHSSAPMECVPVGVTRDADGTVWAVEDCGGGIISYRLN
ncbi:hypothetical protein [Antrihabitans cavernicola]|uniref:Uncharacterized protein n=1 Tax=Antrihabitans cavernicola TaxID=2495913 RepID=A0A5A7SJW9_9NOCA|nr:hypothetical protein [Spelaeibacter cavernicola]KAA0024735.1 hypothetical protein FOY51_02015 [Spelaeibacter cavernicola]